jgi:hypothetical protein
MNKYWLNIINDWKMKITMFMVEKHMHSVYACLYGVQMRSAAKSLMYRYFEYGDKNDIELFYCHTDSILIKESDLDKMNRFISKESWDFKIDSK